MGTTASSRPALATLAGSSFSRRNQHAECRRAAAAQPVAPPAAAPTTFEAAAATWDEQLAAVDQTTASGLRMSPGAQQRHAQGVVRRR